VTRCDGAIDFDWGPGSPDPALPVDGFSVRWSGTISLAAAGSYTFTTTSDDGVRLQVDGQTVIDRWLDQGVSSYSATLSLAAGDHSVVLAYYENTGEAVARLRIADSTGCPSGVCMPVGDLPGWRQVFSDDFNQDVPLGSFPDAVASSWTAYPYPWSGTPAWATYDPHRTTSFHDGVQDIWIHTVDGEHLIAANMPRLPGGGSDQLYGRYAIRYRSDSFGYYKPSWLLWPRSGNWPTDGEIDFPEQGQFSDSSVCAFMHHQDGTSGGDQDAYCSGGYDTTAWHTAVIEWTPSRCTFILDGKTIGNSTSRIPDTPMDYVIQNDGAGDTGAAPDNAQGHIYIDWITIYAPA
jgi:hypothetical protein